MSLRFVCNLVFGIWDFKAMAIIRWDPFKDFDRFFDEDWGLVPMHRPMKFPGEEAQAEYEKGVLKITIPKAEETKAKKVQVRVKK